MKQSTAWIVVAIFLGGCAPPRPDEGASAVPLPLRLESYFEEYCDYTRSLGIGFVPEHTWDYRFRHRLKTTADPELKRLFVLEHLHQDVKFALRDFADGKLRTGKASYRPLTLDEWHQTRQDIQRRIDDLTTYASFTNFASSAFDPLDSPDPSLDAAWIQELRQQLLAITNAPAANTSLHSTPR